MASIRRVLNEIEADPDQLEGAGMRLVTILQGFYAQKPKSINAKEIIHQAAKDTADEFWVTFTPPHPTPPQHTHSLTHAFSLICLSRMRMVRRSQ